MKIKSNVAWQVVHNENLQSAIVELKSLGWRYAGCGCGRYYFECLTSDGGLQLLEVVR